MRSVNRPLSFTVSPETVREKTPLAPLLLQTEELITDLLAQRLHQKISSTTLGERKERIGVVRKSLVSADGTPVYLAVTVIANSPWTQKLARELKKVPPPLFGALLKKEGLFGRKTPPEVRRAPVSPENAALLQADQMTETWERTYAILTPKNVKVAGVTEIFSPKLEELLREHPAQTRSDLTT